MEFYIIECTIVCRKNINIHLIKGKVTAYHKVVFTLNSHSETTRHFELIMKSVNTQVLFNQIYGIRAHKNY